MDGFDYQSMTLAELAQHMGQRTPGSVSHGVVMAEFTRRQAEWQRQASAATVKAANWTRWSVVAIAVTSGAQAVFALMNWLYPHAPR